MSTTRAPRKSPAKTVKKRTAGARSTGTRQVLTEHRRGEIIAAALKVFARNGFHATRAEDVAAQAHIAKGTLYLYFKSKDAIYEAALKHALSQLEVLIAERLQGATTAAERVYATVLARLEFWDDHGELYRMILTLGREKKHRRRTAALIQDAVSALVEILNKGIESGELKRVPPEPIAWAGLDLLRGSNERRLNGTSSMTTAAEARFITDTVIRYFN